jgi:tripeptide aminopeptidase
MITMAQERVEALLQRADVQRGLAWIEAAREHFVQELTALSRIAAPTFAEGPRAEHMARRLRELGTEKVRIDGAGNVVAGLGGDVNEPGLLIAAHLDTVFGPQTDLTLARRQDRLYGPGVGDNCAGLAGLVLTFEAMRAAGIQPKRPLWLAATTAEEGLGDLRGMRAVMDELGGRLHAVVAVEGALLGRVTHQAVGSRRWRVRFHGPGGHSWHDYGRPSAINAAGRAIAALADLKLAPEPRAVLNVGSVEGGSGVNVIAAEAVLLLDMRSVDVATLADLTRRVEDVLRQAARQEGVTIEIDTVGNRPAGAIPVSAPLVQMAVAVLRHLQIAPRFEPASTDANIPLSRGIPAITVGVTYGGGVHTEGEWIDIQPAVQGIQHLLLLAAALTC